MIQPTFNPQDHLTIIDGAAYLEVKWRLVWLRDAYPNSRVETEAVQIDAASAVFRAAVTVIEASGEVRTSGTGHGAEFRERFESYVEAAETKAIGRALATCGFGTQFASEFLDAASGRIADAPIRTTAPARQQAAPTAPPQTDASRSAGAGPAAPANGQAMSEAAKTFFFKLADMGSVDSEDISNQIRERFGKEPGEGWTGLLDTLTRREGAILTNDWLKPLVGFVDRKES